MTDIKPPELSPVAHICGVTIWAYTAEQLDAYAEARAKQAAELARQDEREECARIAETAPDVLQNSTFDGVAQAIRARGSDK